LASAKADTIKFARNDLLGYQVGHKIPGNWEHLVLTGPNNLKAEL